MWITGAGKGIGKALAKLYLEDSWVVAISARTEADLSKIRKEHKNQNIGIFPMDVSDLEQTVRTVAQIEQKLGVPNLVILNAGTHLPVSVENFSVDAVRHLIDVNFMGVVNALSEIIPRFIDSGGGHIVVVASLAGYRGLPTASAYGASKAALINMCEGLRPDLMIHNIRLTLVNPGFVKTPLTDKNEFDMPFIVSSEEAAKQIFNGLKKNDFEITFPKKLALPMKVLRLLPYKVFFALTKRMTR